MEFVLEALEVLLRVRDEAISGKQMRVRAVADIRPVEEVSVVADLPVGLAAFPDVVKAGGALPVSRADSSRMSKNGGCQCYESSLTRKFLLRSTQSQNLWIPYPFPILLML